MLRFDCIKPSSKSILTFSSWSFSEPNLLRNSNKIIRTKAWYNILFLKGKTPIQKGMGIFLYSTRNTYSCSNNWLVEWNVQSWFAL